MNMRGKANEKFFRRGGWYTGLSLLLLLGALALLLWRFRYSFCWSDESYYLSTVHRFWLGDAPFQDEWNTGQLYAALLLPFYSVWRALTGSTEGVYLAARLAAVVLIFALALALWRALGRRWPAAGLAGALLVLFYAKANLAGLSYYTLCFFFFLGGLLLLYSLADQQLTPPAGPAPSRGTKAWWVTALAGVLLALAVVCMPLTALLWLAVLPPLLFKGLRPFRPAALGLTAGGFLAAAVYLGWMFSRVSPAALLENLPYVLRDPDSNAVSLPVLLLKFVAQPFYQLWPGLILWGPALAFSLWVSRGGQRPIEGPARVWLLRAALVGFLLNVLGSGAMLGRAHLALCVLGAQCWLLCPRPARPTRELAFLGLPGLAFALIWQLGSNTGFSAMTLGFVVACPFGAACVEALFRAKAGREGAGAPVTQNALTAPRSRRLTAALLALTLALPVAASAWQRVALVYRDAPLRECTACLTQGPARGLYTSPQAAAQYQALYETVTGDEARGPLFISALAPWAYLCTDRPVAAPTTWRVYTDSPTLKSYYTLYPARLPQTVLILHKEMGAYRSTVQPEENPAPNTPAGQGFLLELLARDYTSIDTPAGTLYRRGGR